MARQKASSQGSDTSNDDTLDDQTNDQQSANDNPQTTTRRTSTPTKTSSTSVTKSTSSSASVVMSTPSASSTIPVAAPAISTVKCFGGYPGVPMQNASSWSSTGCMKGFYCPNNTAEALPAYCPPGPLCQLSRLSGRSCDPQGPTEPVLCQAGFYCPIIEGKSFKIQCPAGSFCRKGSDTPTKCGAMSRCKAGSFREFPLPNLGVLIIIDIMLIAAVIFMKLRSFYNSRLRKGKPVNQKAAAFYTKGPAAAFKGAKPFRGKQYEQLDDEQSHGSTGYEATPMVTMNQHPALRRQPTGFAQMGSVEQNFSVADLTQEDNNGADRTDLARFVQSLSRILGASKFGLSFEFQNLHFHPKKSPRPILQDVSGCIDAGSLWGVMGASGAGKSTFVNVLMGKQSGITGVTKVNGVAGDIKKYKKIIGYVPQDDIVLPELTVRENILHSARIRLPQSWNDKEIQNHVDILLNCLQLDHVKNSLVGSPGAPVISGGQRKRVSIGMELAAAPMALYLDEPTSGLDATAAASIMSTLKALSRLGMTIVVVIHQPRPEIFESLDSLVLLGKGQMIYQGPQHEIRPYLEHYGFSFPASSNPADIMGDIIAGEGRHYKSTGEADVPWLIEQWATNHPSIALNSDKVSTISASEINSLTTTIKQRGAPFYRQMWYCFQRSLLQQYRMKSSFFFEMGVGAMSGFLIGLAQLSAKGDNFSGIFNNPYEMLSSSVSYSNVPQMALLVGLAIGLTASAPGVKIFGEEKLVFWREAAAGHNRFSYYMGKVLSTIPRMILANFHFTTFFMLLTTPRISFIAAFACNLLYFYCIYGLASILSMLTRREDGPLLATMSSLIVGVLNGMSPTLHKVRSWHMQWLWRASPGTWLAEAYFTQNLSPLRYLYQIDIAREALGYHLGEFTHDCLIMLLIGTVYRVVAFLGLRFMYPTKQR